MEKTIFSASNLFTAISQIHKNPLMTSLAERFEDRNRKFLSTVLQDHKPNTAELRKKTRNKLLQQKRVFQSEQFEGLLFEALLLKYPILQSPSLSLSGKYEYVLTLFSECPLSEASILLDAVISFCKSNLVPPNFFSVDISGKLVECLKSGNKELLGKSLNVIINGTYLFEEFKFPLLRKGATGVIIDYITSSWDDRENVADCLWALSHLISDEREGCLMIISSGLADFIIQKIHQGLNNINSVLEYSLQMLSNVFTKLKKVDNPIFDPFLKVVPKILCSSDTQVLGGCFVILMCIAEVREYRTKVAQPEILKRLISGLQSQNKTLSFPAIKCFSSLVNGSDEEIEKVVDLGIIDQCFALLGVSDSGLFAETCFLLKNLAYDREDYKEQIFDSPRFSFLLKKTEDELLDIRIAALDCVEMVISMENYTKVFKRYKELLPCLVRCLKMKDSRVLILALRSINSIFIAYQLINIDHKQISSLLDLFCELQGIDLIHRLMIHPNSSVYSAATEFIMTHLNVDEFEDEDTGFKFN